MCENCESKAGRFAIADAAGWNKLHLVVVEGTSSGSTHLEAVKVRDKAIEHEEAECVHRNSVALVSIHHGQNSHSQVLELEVYTEAYYREQGSCGEESWDFLLHKE